MPKEINQPINFFTWGGDLKSVSDEGILAGNGIVFGSEEEYDLSPYKDFFTADTYVHPDEKFTTTVYMEHGFSYRKPIGKALLYKTDKGWDVTAELNLNDPVVKSRFPEIKSGGWGFSTGAVGHVVEREKKSNGSHHITQWNVGEISITRTPAEPNALIRSVKSLDEYYNVSPDLNVDDLPEPMSELEEKIDINDKLIDIITLLLALLGKTSLEEVLASGEDAGESMDDPMDELMDESMDDSKNVTDDLTVLKSENEILNTQYSELQSSFNEKEALLSEKMALLSETQADLETKIQDLKSLEEALQTSNVKINDLLVEIDSLKESLDKQKKINLALGQNNFN